LNWHERGFEAGRCKAEAELRALERDGTGAGGCHKADTTFTRFACKYNISVICFTPAQGATRRCNRTREVKMHPNVVLFSLAAAAALLFNGPASATLAELLGNWHNVNANTRGIVRIEITNAGGATMVHAWGACHPKPCDWGSVRATRFAPNVSSPLPASTQYLEAVFKTGFSLNTLVIGPSPAPGGVLRSVTLTRFTDNSRRSAYADTEGFKK
jgi:hypothetical protein